MKAEPVRTRIFQPGENLVDFITEHINSLSEGDVIAVTSKIAALSENRLVKIGTVKDKEELIKKESDIMVHHPYGWLTVRNGLMVGSGGIDESNVKGDYYVMLPKNCMDTAWMLHTKLREHFRVNNLGIIVTDSRLMPLKQGTLGAAFGYAGFKPLKTYVGAKDLFGREFKRQKANLPDSLATAAVLVMGEGAEQTPLALISGITLEFIDSREEDVDIKIRPQDDVYYFFYNGIKGS